MVAPKFKAWDKKEKSFIDFNKIEFWEDGSIWYLQGLEDCKREFTQPYFKSEDSWILIQSTGLFDVEGVEVWSGDVIFDTFSGEHYEVVFKMGMFGCEKNRKINLHTNEKITFVEPLHSHLLNGAYVVGTVYENPELLEDKSENIPTPWTWAPSDFSR